MTSFCQNDAYVELDKMCDLTAKVGKIALQKVFTLLSKWGESDLFCLV